MKEGPHLKMNPAISLTEADGAPSINIDRYEIIYAILISIKT